jgi:hypothetical protein
MSSHRNTVLDLSNSIESSDILNSLYEASKGKAEGRIKCTITKHRVAKTAIILGIRLLSRKPKGIVLGLIERWAPLRLKSAPGVRSHKRMVKTELVLECSSTQGLLEGVDKVWRAIDGAVSHRRVTKAALTIGLDSLNKIDPGKVRQLVSKVCPVPKKYYDQELQQWL